MGRDYKEVVKVISINILYHTLRVEDREEGKLEAARNALIEGIEPIIVAKITNLPLETIRKIKEELAN